MGTDKGTAEVALSKACVPGHADSQLGLAERTRLQSPTDLARLYTLCSLSNTSVHLSEPQLSFPEMGPPGPKFLQWGLTPGIARPSLSFLPLPHGLLIPHGAEHRSRDIENQEMQLADCAQSLSLARVPLSGPGTYLGPRTRLLKERAGSVWWR